MILFQWSPCVEEAMSLVDQLTHDFLTTQTELLSANPRAQPVALDVDTKAVIWITGSEMRSNIYIYISGKDFNNGETKEHTTTLFGWRPLLLGWKLLGWRPSLVGGRPSQLETNKDIQKQHLCTDTLRTVVLAAQCGP